MANEPEAVPAGLRGRLLVALPALRDPNFDRTVLLVLEHTSDGAMALVVNRPSDTPVGDPLPAWDAAAVEPSVVFVGGPVGTDAAIGLARSPRPGPGTGWAPLFDQLGTVDLHGEPADVDAPLEGVRIFAGHAGWSAGQLDGELAEGAWAVIDALPSDAHSVAPDRLWRSVLRRQGGRLAWLANHPLDPSEN